MARPDFVEVQLSPEGVLAAGNGAITINGTRKSYEFKPGVVVEVDRAFTWTRWLSRLKTNGSALLQIVAPPVPAAQVAKPAVAAAAAPAAAAPRPTAETVSQAKVEAATEGAK